MAMCQLERLCVRDCSAKVSTGTLETFFQNYLYLVMLLLQER